MLGKEEHTSQQLPEPIMPRVLRNGIGKVVQSGKKGSLRKKTSSGLAITVKANPASCHHHENPGLTLGEFPHVCCWQRNEARKKLSMAQLAGLVQTSEV